MKNLHDVRRKSNRTVKARPWKLMIGLRRKPNHGALEFCVSGSDGRTHIGFFGGSVFGFQGTALLQAEFRGLAQSLDWAKHQAPNSKTRISISTTAYAIFAGEQICPFSLQAIRLRLLRKYAELPNVKVVAVDLMPTLPAQERRMAA